MNEFVCYRLDGNIKVINAGTYANIREWRDICREAGAEMVGIGMFDSDISAELYFRDVAKLK